MTKKVVKKKTTTSQQTGWLSPNAKVETVNTNTEGQRFATTAARHNQRSSTRQQDFQAVKTTQKTFGTTPDMVQLPNGHWVTRQDAESSSDFVTAYDDNGRQYRDMNVNQKGLEIVSPEFDLLTLGRSLMTEPAGLFNLSGMKDVPGNYYRQGRGIVDDALKTGMVTVKSAAKKKIINKKGITFDFGKEFTVPFWSKGQKWFGKRPIDLIVSKGTNNLEWKPITQHGGFTTLKKAGTRRTPLFNGEVNNTPIDGFQLYKHYPFGHLNVTNGLPHVPITGLNTGYNLTTDKKALGGKKQIAPNVIRGGQAIPLGNNFYYMHGRKHSQGGIDIGKDLEVEGGEVMQMGGKSLKVFSSLPFLNGQSPAQRVMNGENANQVFNAQEKFKKVNKINDDGTMKRYKSGGTYTVTANGRTNLRFISSTGKRTQSRTGSLQREAEERELAISQAHERNKEARRAVVGNLKAFVQSPKLKYLGRAISSAYRGYIAPEHPEVQGGIAPAPATGRVSPKQILNTRSLLNGAKGTVRNLGVKGTASIREGLNTASRWARATRQQLMAAIDQDVTHIKDANTKAKMLASQRAAYRELMKRKAAGAEAIHTQAVNAGRNSRATIDAKNMTDDQLRSFIGENNRLLTGRQQGQAARDVNAARQELNARDAAARVKQARVDKARATREANRKLAEEEAARKAQTNADRAAKAKATREANKLAAENAKYEAELSAKEKANKAAFTKAKNKAVKSNSPTFEHNGSTYFTDSGDEVTWYQLGVGEANYKEAIKNGWSEYENGWGRVSSITEKPGIESYGRAGKVSHTEPQSTSLWQRGKNNVHEWQAQRRAKSYNTKAEQQGHNVRMTTDGKGNTKFTTKEELAARSQPTETQAPATNNNGGTAPTTGDNPPTPPAQPTRWRDRHTVLGYPARHPWKTAIGAGVLGTGAYNIFKSNSTPEVTLPGQSVGQQVQYDYEEPRRRRSNTGSDMDAYKAGGRRKYKIGGQVRGNGFFVKAPLGK